MQLTSLLFAVLAVSSSPTTAVPQPGHSTKPAPPHNPIKQSVSSRPITHKRAPPQIIWPRLPAASDPSSNSSADIHLQCEEAGPQCMTFPPPNGGAPAAANETISVRVYCAVVASYPDPGGNDSQPGVPIIELRPEIMDPCPLGSQCVASIDPG